jgi:cation diffusion facilitator CzcD-associated flavoprotein CzcO
MPMESQEHFDILIMGAGISGIDAAYHLQTAFPRKTYWILEAREAIGGKRRLKDLASFTFGSVSDGTMNFFRTSEAYNGSRASLGHHLSLMIFSTTRRGVQSFVYSEGIYAVC